MKKYALLTVVVTAVVLSVASDALSRDAQGRSNATTVGQNRTTSGSPTGSQPNGAGATTNAWQTNQASAQQSGGAASTTNGAQQTRQNRTGQSGNVTTTSANQSQGANQTAGQGASNQQRQNRAAQTDNMWTRYNQLFTPQWYARHPNVANQVSANTNVWTSTANWSTLANWLGLSGSRPNEYGTVSVDEAYFVTDDGVVGEEQVTVETTSADQTSQNPAELAAQGYTTETAATRPNQWLSIGVFTIAAPGSTSTPDRVFQFSVNKNGHIAGTYYDAFSGKAHQVQGAVNKTTQRAAWTVDSNRETVMETNLGSFTQNQATVLVHQGQGQSDEWVMTRVECPNANQTNQPGATTQSGQQGATGQNHSQGATGTNHTQGTNDDFGTTGTN